MNSVTNTSIYSYNHSDTNNTNIVQSTVSNTSSSTNNNNNNNNNNSDTIEISTDSTSTSNSYNAFITTLHKIASTSATISSPDGSSSTSDIEFITIKEMMKDAGYNIPSFNNNCSSYSSFINKMKDFVSNNSDISYSSQIIDFCNNVQKCLSTYDIN